MKGRISKAVKIIQCHRLESSVPWPSTGNLYGFVEFHMLTRKRAGKLPSSYSVAGARKAPVVTLQYFSALHVLILYSIATYYHFGS